MKTAVQAPIRIERIPGTKLVRMIAPFYFYSEVLGRAGCIPVGFIYDEERVYLYSKALTLKRAQSMITCVEQIVILLCHSM